MNYKDIIFLTENAVIDYMRNQNVKEIRMFVTAYINNSNQQQWGYSLENINSDYYYNQKTISSKTKTFKMK